VHDALPIHLLLPLAASIIFVFGLMLIKRAGSGGAGPWAVTFVGNLWAAVVFAPLGFFGRSSPPLVLYWQPLAIAVLYILGQIFTFVALAHGDVSVAAPALSIKVVLVAVLITWIAQENVPQVVWAAAVLATVGIMLVQRGERSGVGAGRGRTLVFALLSASTFALFDVLVQSWAPAWGATTLLPIIFGTAAVLSVGFLPWMGSLRRLPRETGWLLAAGTFLVALQALCLVFTIAHFGDAPRVNIVYSLRGLWGVVLAFAFARVMKSGEANVAMHHFVSRLIGAALVMAAVVLAISAG
jgi:drug/metabolite transporter (DMT)-like permease